MTVSTEKTELKAKWQNDVEVKTYKKQEVLKHNTKHDLWIIIHGKVYDVTEYVKDHPGGVDVLMEVAGADATSAYEDVGHSEDAGEIMQAYLKGVLEGAVVEDPSAGTTNAVPNVQIVRRNDEAASKAPPTHDREYWLKLIAFVTSTSGLAYLVSHFHLLSSLSKPGLQAFDPRSGSRGFAQGFLTASAAISIAGVLGARFFSNSISFGKSFSSYAPHLQSTTPASKFRPTGILSPTEYQKFKLRRKDELSDGIYRFVFDLPTKYSVLGLPIGQHVAVKANLDEHTVVRSYTPVSNNRDLGRLELLIRVYPDGQVGNFLKNLQIGDFADIRGPKGAMKYRRGMSKKIGMVGGGTGITPLYQLIRAICEDQNDDTEISLIYGNRSESDIMLRDRLDHYAKTVPHKFKVFYTLDQPSASWKGNKGHVTKDLLKERMPPPPSSGMETKVLLCGPPGMVNAMKKNLVELGYVNPGAVCKMSDEIFCF